MTTKKVDDLTIEELNHQVALCNDWSIRKLWADWYMDKNDIHIMMRNDYTPCTTAQQAEDDSLLIAAMRCYVKSIKGEEVEL